MIHGAIFKIDQLHIVWGLIICSEYMKINVLTVQTEMIKKSLLVAN